MTDSDMGQANAGAPSPLAIPAAGWMAVLKRTWAEISDDNIGLVAAGIAFYAFAATIPLLGAVVLSYGLFADPDTVRANIEGIFASMPREAATLITDQLSTVLATSRDKQGIGLVVAIVLALYGATKGASAVVTGLNIAYEEHETRGFVRLNLLNFVIVIGGIGLVFVAMAATALLAFLESLVPNAPGAVLVGIRLAGYLVLGALVVTAAACAYRYAPARRKPSWVWLSPGSIAATILWLGGTIGFGVYVASFGNYGATYGSLSAVIVTLTWLWLSAFVFLLGAELNAEIERQIDAEAEGHDPSADKVPAANTPAAAQPKRLSQPRPTSGGTSVAALLPLNGSLIGSLGFLLIRRRRPAGFALVGLGAVMAWRSRRTTHPKSSSRSS